MFQSIIAATSFTLLTALAQAAVSGPGDYYVNTNETQERLAPSPTAKSTNTLFKRQKVTVMEIKGEWARVSKYYDGGVEGINGNVARWIAVKDLASQRPPEERLQNAESALSAALKDSDNFAKHQKVFVSASQKLINDGTCKLSDFEGNGGWTKSSNYKPQEVYFTYCGGMTRNGRIYLDASNGQTFR